MSGRASGPINTAMARTVEAGVDWLTLTCKDDKKQAGLRQVIGEVFAGGTEIKDYPEKWEFMGYVGCRQHGLRYGERRGELIVMASGDDARMMWYALVPFADQCSRLDLAVTVMPARAIAALASQCYAEIQHHPEMRLNRVYSYITSTRGGGTLYVGMRTSQQFGRLYDKSLQENPMAVPGSLWRYEVELKKPIAWQTLNRLSKLEQENCFPKCIVSTVFDWFDGRGVPPIFKPSAVPAVGLVAEARATSDDVRLAWLSGTVKPVLLKLANHGLTPEAVEALGLVDALHNVSRETA